LDGEATGEKLGGSEMSLLFLSLFFGFLFWVPLVVVLFSLLNSICQRTAIKFIFNQPAKVLLPLFVLKCIIAF